MLKIDGSSRSPDRRHGRKVEKRGAAILNLLSGGGEMSVEEVIVRAGASPATVRRDLQRLEQQGLVRRAHGVVALAHSSGFEPLLHEADYREQLHRMAPEKRRIGAAAAAMVAPGETIALAPGSTVAEMSRMMRSHRNLMVITNALNVASDFSRQKGVAVQVTGGYLGGDWLAMVGPKALDFIATMFPDKFFFGANGIHAEHGVTDNQPDEAAVNHAMVRQSRKRIVLVDHTKLGHTARCQVCPVQEVDMVITDTGATDDMVAPFERLGIEVVRV